MGGGWGEVGEAVMKKESPRKKKGCLTFSFRRIICYAIKAPSLTILMNVSLNIQLFINLDL